MASGLPLLDLVWSEYWINRSWDVGSLLVVVLLAVAWGGASVVALRVLRWAWWTPRRLERVLRQQGIGGNPYQLLVGDMRDLMRLNKEARSRPMPAISHDIAPRVYPLLQQSMAKHGKICYTWFGPYPRVIVRNLDMIRDILSNKFAHFEKPKVNPLGDLLVTGLVAYEGDKWAKRRRIINPAFHVEKLKRMLPAFSTCCAELIARWENLVGPNGSYELDVWPELQIFTGDVISRTAFGSSFEEGRRIFQLQVELADLLIQGLQNIFIPGSIKHIHDSVTCKHSFFSKTMPYCRFFPTKRNRRMKEIAKEVRGLLRNMIMKREEAMKLEITPNDDLLSLLLESNLKYYKENGTVEKFKMTIEDVIEECKLFYFAGQETTSVLLTWTMVVLSVHPSWQASAREEVLQVFGKAKPDFDSLSQLKVVTMILYEVLRLYPPATFLLRTTYKTMKLGGFTFPSGVHFLLPILSIHHDPMLWGADANEFNPQRFAEGVSKASKHQMAFIPFSSGPRICIGQNFAMAEAKLGLATILQHFIFELAPSYRHAPYTVITLQPQHGAQLILHKL
ncbi:hypothetical protein Taro_036167 [Colocasia esculenta]|uniref:Cytochrome P450 n=1 Tax=Colocasia esculenta TaxID=4460 RepID=A0A843W8X1_COLES|nr:hypothetical protein [Colocasia esculenta]